jgi:hypothetical protein
MTVRLELTENEAHIVMAALSGALSADLMERTNLSFREVMNARGSVDREIIAQLLRSEVTA